MNAKTKNINQIITHLQTANNEIEKAKKYIEGMEVLTFSKTVKIMSNCFDNYKSLASIEKELISKTLK